MNESASIPNPMTVKVWASPPLNQDAPCDSVTHYFDSPSGKCHCGKSEWDPPPEKRPKLRLVE